MGFDYGDLTSAAQIYLAFAGGSIFIIMLASLFDRIMSGRD